MRPDLFELPDVLHLRGRRRRQRPQLLDILAAHVEEPGADRREQPLVQRRAVVVALEIAQLEREMRERVRAVDDRLNGAAARHPRDLAHGKQLTREVRHVAQVNDARLRRDRLLESRSQLRQVLRRHRERDLRQRDPVAPHALLPRVEHAAVILVRRDHLVARLQIEAELRDLQCLARIARDGELLGVASGFGREVAAHRLHVRLEHVPHVMNGRLVRHVEVSLQRLVHDARARTGVAIVEIDDRAVERERLLNVAPVGLVGRDFGRRAVGDGRRRRRDAPEPVRFQRSQTHRARWDHTS